MLRVRGGGGVGGGATRSQEVIGNNLPGFQKKWNPSKPVQRENILTYREYLRIFDKWQTTLHSVRRWWC